MWDIPSLGVNISVGCQKQVMKEAISVKFRSNRLSADHSVARIVPFQQNLPSQLSYGSMRVAVKRGSTLYHLHGDHLGSTSLTTRGSSETASRADFAYGAERSSSGDLQTDRTFTGQKRDATGLMYYNARDYDPALGTFVSPDSMVPGAGQVINYNRFLYARGNPLKYSDPSGYIPVKPTGPPVKGSPWEEEFYWKNRWYEARGWAYNPGTNHWDRSIPNRFADLQIWAEYVDDLLTDLQEDPSKLSFKDWKYVGRIVLAEEIYRRRPEGASSFGLMGDYSPVASFLGDFGVFIDKSGNVAFGHSLGAGASTGLNVDVALYVQNFPTASSYRCISRLHGTCWRIFWGRPISRIGRGGKSGKRGGEKETYHRRNSLLANCVGKGKHPNSPP